MESGNFEQISSRALSKQGNNSGENSSFRVYYGGAAVAIPFRWESRPGTPKHTFSETSLPPLTPPPSYYSSSHCTSKTSSKQTLMSSIFPRFTPKKSRTFSSSSVSSFSSSSLASWSSSHSSFSSSPSRRPKLFKRHSCRSLDSPSLPFEYNVDVDDGDHESSGRLDSPTPTFCFRGCYQLVSVKKTLMSIVGHGSTKRGNVN